MNEPLRHKLFSVYGQILNERTLREAWGKVRSNGGAGGVDGVTIAEFEADLDANMAALLADLRAKEYRPSPVRRVRIPKKGGRTRPLGIPTIRDRVVQQALVTRMQPFFEERVFHRDSCGFRPGVGVEDALRKVVWNLETGCRYVYDFDIRGYFDSIPHKKLMRTLAKYVSDGTVLDLIWRSLKAGYMERGCENACGGAVVGVGGNEPGAVRAGDGGRGDAAEEIVGGDGVGDCAVVGRFRHDGLDAAAVGGVGRGAGLLAPGPHSQIHIRP